LQQYYGIKTNNLVWDTMVAAHCLYCDLPKDLGTLISIYTNLPYHKYLVHSGKLMDRWEYNAADALANIHIMKGQQDEFNDYGTLHHYENIVHPAIDTCISMHLFGTAIDSKLRDKALDELDCRMHHTERAFDSIFTTPIGKKRTPRGNFNPVSSKQKAVVFYDLFKCKKQFKLHSLTTDKHAMDFFTLDNRPIVSLVAQACLEYKAASVMVGRLNTKTTSGRMHCKYDITGTDTGRLNSCASDLFNSGTNLQNLAKGLQRQMIIPDDGYEFLISDLHSAEAFLVAIMAGEMELVKLLQSGVKVYTYIQEVTQERYPDECRNAEYSTAFKGGYKKAKSTVHALNYGVQPPTMSVASGLPLYVCQWQYAFYHTKFPGIQGRMKAIETQVTRHKILTSLLGRQRVFFQKKDNKLLHIANAWPTQSAIGEITIAAMTKLRVITERHLLGDTSLPYVRPILNTHDGIVAMVKIGTREESIAAVIDAFNIPLRAGKHIVTVPIAYAFASNFNDTEEEHVHFYI